MYFRNYLNTQFYLSIEISDVENRHNHNTIFKLIINKYGGFEIVCKNIIEIEN